MAKDDDILEAARKRLQLCIDAEHDDRAAALDDLKFLGGKQWDPAAEAQRKLEGRPCMTFNKLPAFLRQITNDQRQNTPGIKVHPVDSGADVETAQVVQGMIRHIEYESNADIAYDTAVSSAAACGRGFFRLVTEYESETSFNQVIRFKRIRNPLNVYIDPFSQELDGSDMRFAFLTDVLPRDDFKREYPKANAADPAALQGLGDSARGWFRDEGVVVAEYYWLDHEEATLVLLSDGSTAFEDELDIDALQAGGISVLATRSSMRRRVRWAKVTACDVLEQRDIPCYWIPVFPVYGDELDIEGRVIRKGMVRDAKDPSRMYNFWMTSATEEIALRPKVPFIGAEGQFNVDRPKWLTANVRSYPFIQYKPVTVDGLLAPPPARQPMADVPVGVLQMAMHASDDIKATTGIYDASLGARGNETSGRAILARQREGDVSNYHFTDNLNKAVRHAGRCIVDMIPRVYDTHRVVRIRGEDETIGFVEVNKPVVDGAVERVLNDLSVGRYDVTVTAGPSYTTQRQEAAEGMTQLAQAWPPLMEIAGDKVVENLDWPGADEIAKRIKRRLPPDVLEEDGGAPGVPPEAQQEIVQLQQTVQHLQAALQEAHTGIEKARIDAESRERVAMINAQSRADVEELKGLVKLLLAKLQPPAQLVHAAYDVQAPTPPGQPIPASALSEPASAGFFMSGPMQSDPVGPTTTSFQATSGALTPDDTHVSDLP